MAERTTGMKILFLNTFFFVPNLNEFLLGKILIIIPESLLKRQKMKELTQNMMIPLIFKTVKTKNLKKKKHF